MNRVRPTFMIIGAMKCATTTLADILKQHPSVCMSEPKEVDFFYRDTNYEKGWEWYATHFHNWEGKAAVGEASPNYSKYSLSPRSAERIAKDLPDIRLIYIVRHPIKRIESHWQHNFLARDTELSLAEAIQQQSHYLDTSLYWRQISVYRQFFSDDQIQVFFAEDLRNDPKSIVDRCFEFIGLDGPQSGINYELESHLTADKKMDFSLLERAKKNRFLKSIHRNLKFVTGRLLPLLRYSPNLDVTWPAELKKRVIDEIRPDAEQFLRKYGKPADFWKLD